MAAQETELISSSIAPADQLSRLFDVDEEATIESVRKEIDSGRQYPGSHVSVRVVPVHTFILQDISKDFKLSKGILVPSFASHWGIVTGEPGHFTLYHLVFSRNPRLPQKDLDTTRGPLRAVRFEYLDWPPEGRESKGHESMTKVGVTSRSHQDMVIIGKSMIRAFGDYHRVFWNCQTFAKCYLKIICGRQATAKFDAWTMSDASNMFLCAFIVGIPLATTLKQSEIVHIRKLLNAVETQNPPSTADLEKISDYAIDCILQQACTEPENRDILRVPLPEKGFFNWLENLIFRNKKQE